MSRFKPWSTQAEQFVLGPYLLQFCTHFAFTVVWWYFAHIGEKSIVGKAIIVDENSTENELVANYDRVGYLLHLLLYIFVVAHQTILIQVAHVSKQKFMPISRILVATLVMLVTCIIINFVSP